MERNTRASRPHDPATDLLAAGLAMTGGLVAGLSAAWFALEARLWHDRQLVGYAVVAAATGVAALGVYLLARWLFRRAGVRWWQVATAVVVMLLAGSAVPSVAGYVFPDPYERFDRELGGPGQCLNSTPYATDNGFPRSSHMDYSEHAPGRMTVTPLDTSVPPLVLDHAVRGGLHHLTPGDARSAEILRAHGC